MSFQRDVVVSHTSEGWFLDDELLNDMLGPFATANDLQAEMDKYPNPGSLHVFTDTDEAKAEWDGRN